ncbi:MAG TPA: alpha/beta hydrolase [Candidatus Solibacter sp.]|nr:alpha/beta hydrolase [Candidatus Solibacter sp.]
MGLVGSLAGGTSLRVDAAIPTCTAPATFQCAQAAFITNLVYGNAPNTITGGPDVSLTADIYRPRDFGVASRGATVVLVHGGSWNAGDKATGNFIWASNDLAAHGYIVYNIDLRMAPCVGIGCTSFSGTGRYFDEINDVQSAVNFASIDSSRFGGKGRVALVGSSSGGHLADMTALVMGAHGALRSVVSLSGPAELQPDKYLDVLTGAYPTDTQEPAILDYVGCPFWGTPPTACPTRYGAVSPAESVTSSNVPPIFQSAATADYAGGMYPIYAMAQRFRSALNAAGVTNTLETPSVTTCHAIGCWYISSTNTGNTVETDAISWLRRTVG